MKCDLGINGGHVVTDSWEGNLQIGVTDGKIAYLGTDIVDANQTIDASGLTVLPGAIDAHTHFRSPAYPEKETFASGTAAAAAGGVTSVLEMPMADVGTSTGEILRSRSRLLQQQAVVDFGLYGGVGEGNLADLGDLKAQGAIGFKTFMRTPYPGRATNFSDTWIDDEQILMHAALRIQQLELPWAIHAENHKWTVALEDAYADQEDMDGERLFRIARPDSIEIEPVNKLLALGAEIGLPIHLVHLSTPESIRLVAAAKSRSVDVTCEVCLPHLMVSDEAAESMGARGRVSPRLRPAIEVEELWRQVSIGQVDLIASDHASYRTVDLETGWDHGGKPQAGGVASVEHMVGCLLQAAKDRRMPTTIVVELVSSSPARRFGLWPRKGALLPGSDADMAAFNLEVEGSVQGSRMLSKAGWSLLEGVPTVGPAEWTMVRGEVVWREGKIVGPEGWGQFLRPNEGVRSR